MGYGGFIKKVIRIAVPAVVGVLSGGNPLAIAIASAATTGATGGSFKDALISGATSYIGASITWSLNAGTLGGTPSGPPAPTFTDWRGAGGNIPVDVGAGAAASSTPGIDAFLGKFGQTPVGIPSAFAQAPVAASGIGLFPEAFGDVRSAFDAGGSLLDKSLANLGVPELGAKVGQQFGTDTLFTIGGQQVSGANLANIGIGGFAGLTLEQALLANDPLVDAQLEQAGFSPAGIQSLRQEARNRLAQQKFEELTGEGSALANPFLRGGQDEAAAQAAREEFQKVIASGIERENVALGPSVTEAQFNQAFEAPDFGQAILGEEETLRKQSFGQEIGQAFPGDVFQELDEGIISSIVQERQGPAQEQISKFGARGNLNPTGGQTANLFIQGQVPRARERVAEIGSGVLGGIRGDIGEIRGRAEEEAGGYRLGEDLFDVTPFREERETFIGGAGSDLLGDVRTAVGPESLFDVSGALLAGGRRQGVVPGGGNKAFLDQIAARGLGSTSGLSNRRGLGSRGSGAF